MGKGVQIDGDGDADAGRKWVSPCKPARLTVQSRGRSAALGRPSKKKLPKKKQYLVRRSPCCKDPNNNNICREWPLRHRTGVVCKPPEEEGEEEEEEDDEEDEVEEDQEREKIEAGRFWKHWSEPSMPCRRDSQHQLRLSSSALRRSVTHFDVRHSNSMYNGTFEDSRLARLFDSCWIGTKAKEDEQGGDYQRPPRMLVRVALLNSIIHTVRLIVDYDATVYEVIQAAVRAFREGPWPPRVVPTQEYSLHMSAFCLQSLDPEDRIKWAGSRSFVLCPSKLSQNLE